MKKGNNNKKKVPEEKDPSKKEIMRKCRETDNMDEILYYTTNADADIRLEAVKQLCPCKVERDIEAFWDRVFDMVDDEDARIRQRVLHILCDGSPAHLEYRVMDAVDIFNRDKDSDIRRQAHKVMSSYQHTGKWNIM